VSTANEHDIAGGGPQGISTPTHTPGSNSLSDTHAWQNTESRTTTPRKNTRAERAIGPSTLPFDPPEPSGGGLELIKTGWL
jgi:hypothetical protein